MIIKCLKELNEIGVFWLIFLLIIVSTKYSKVLGNFSFNFLIKAWLLIDKQKVVRNIN